MEDVRSLVTFGLAGSAGSGRGWRRWRPGPGRRVEEADPLRRRHGSTAPPSLLPDTVSCVTILAAKMASATRRSLKFLRATAHRRLRWERGVGVASAGRSRPHRGPPADGRQGSGSGRRAPAASRSFSRSGGLRIRRRRRRHHRMCQPHWDQ